MCKEKYLSDGSYENENSETVRRIDKSKIALYEDEQNPRYFGGPAAVADMFEHTDRDGILCIPAVFLDSGNRCGGNRIEKYYKCRMSPDRAAANVISAFEIIIRFAETRLGACMAIHRCCLSREKVDTIE